MRRLMIFILLAGNILANGQDTTVPISTLNNKLTVKEVYGDAKTGFKDALGGLRDLAGKLEGPAKHVYSVYIYQHRAEGVTFIILPLILLFLASVLLYRYWEKADWDDGNKACYATGIGVVLFLAFVGTTIALFAGPYFTEIINPEYYAIQDVVKMFK